VSVTGGHEIKAIAGKPDDFRFDARSVTGDNIASVANGCLTADGFKGESDHTGQRTFDRGGRSALDTPEAAFEAAGPDSAAIDVGVRRAHDWIAGMFGARVLTVQ
jgi:hypothetical protein